MTLLTKGTQAFIAAMLVCGVVHAKGSSSAPAQHNALTPEIALAIRAMQTEAFKIVLVGDSTVATEGGWGPGFCATLTLNVACVDLAKNGRSTKSFIDEGLWQQALAEKGKYYFFQFGHNDQKNDPARHAAADGLYRENLKRFIRETRAIGGTPIILTPLSRRNYETGKLVDDGLKAYAAAARDVAAEERAGFIDLFGLSQSYLSGLTQQEADKFDADTHPDAKAENAGPSKPDRTHLNDKGKAVFGRMVAEGVIRTQPELEPDVRTLRDGR
jgi:lysophospholipase L1-like esterase